MALWYKNQLISKAKTDVQKNTQDPVFGKTIYFDLPELDEDGLKDVKLDLAVMDKDWGKDDLIGRLVLGGENCVGSCLEHWNRLIECPLQDVEMWHPLCDLGAVTTKLAIKSESTECDLDKTLPSDQVSGSGMLISLCHQPDNKNLIVKMIKARNLEKTGLMGKADPYVKTELWHKDRLIAKAATEVQKNTQDPVFNETVFFDLPELDSHGLKLVKVNFYMMDEDFGSKDDKMGHIVIGGENNEGSALLHWNKVIASPNQESEMWHPFLETGSTTKLAEDPETKEQLEPLVSSSDILLSICYQANSKKLILKVIKARNLPKLDTFGLVDPYVKIFLLHNGQRIAKKRKTNVKKRTLNPEFNETFVFDLPYSQEELKNVELDFIVFDWDRLSKNEEIGHLVLGGEKCMGAALHHWNEVFASSGNEITGWHSLCTSNSVPLTD